MSRAHSHLSASSAERWFNCPGSVRLSQQVPPQPTSIYAQEGTDAHALLEEWLYKRLDGDDIVWNSDDDMQIAVYTALEYITERFDSFDYSLDKVLIEARFDLSFIYPDMFGTADFTGYKPEENILYVVDYKHGKGVDVSAEENKQLMYYAIGAINHFKPKRNTTVKMVIIQPRSQGDDIKEFDMTVGELIKWQQTLKEAAQLADSDNAPLKVGNHCRWCPAQAICPAMAKDMFSEVATIEPQELDKKELPKPEVLSKEQLTFIIEHKTIIESWLNSCYSFLETEAINGEKIPGYKLVRRRANRRWVDEEQVKKEFKSLGEKIFSEPKLKSPAQLEKLKGINKEVLSSLTEVPDTGVTLVPESDNREEVAGVTADNMFTIVN